MQIHKVYVRTYGRSFAFSITWLFEDGTLRPEHNHSEIAYPTEAVGKQAEDLWDIFVAGIKEELESTAPLRAERLRMSHSDYCAAVDRWGGDIVVL